jgi:hypothetical protein
MEFPPPRHLALPDGRNISCAIFGDTTTSSTLALLISCIYSRTQICRHSDSQRALPRISLSLKGMLLIACFMFLVVSLSQGLMSRAVRLGVGSAISRQVGRGLNIRLRPRDHASVGMPRRGTRISETRLLRMLLGLLRVRDWAVV